MTDNELILQDRLQKIREVVGKYGEENFYISFSGGKDSTVTLNLIDMALPNNRIPRVYCNTGIEWNIVRDFVLDMAKEDDRVIVVQPTVPIKPTLEKEGYPFKSKGHSETVYRFQHSGKTPSVQQYLGEREDKEPWSAFKSCPKSLKYQFTEDFTLKVSDKCCLRIKEEPLRKWQKENNKPYTILGIMGDEGGRRHGAKCLVHKGTKALNFQPLAPVTREWEEWFIKTYHIKICGIYAPPITSTEQDAKDVRSILNYREIWTQCKSFFQMSVNNASLFGSLCTMNTGA